MIPRTGLQVFVLVTSLYVVAAWGPEVDEPFDDPSDAWWEGSGGSSSSSSSGTNNNNNDDDAFGFNSNSASFRTPGFDIAQAMHLRSLHGILASISFVALFPLGAILMRCTPLFGRSTWALHATLQLLAYALYAAAAGLGLYLVSEVRIPSSTSFSPSSSSSSTSLLANPATNAHPIIGILVLAALALQPVLGWLHHRRFARLRRRTGVSWAHLWVGRVCVTLGIVNGGLGLGLARAAGGAVVAYAVAAALMWLLWMGVAAVAEVRRQRTAPAEKSASGRTRYGGGSAPGRDGPSPPYTPGPVYRGSETGRGRYG
ncbi:hypothetical protein F4810DRAFT_254703 [Camillea tinctor]|nr:hypothetical protein F4810DRAFT_254703 [Camillea tinctor]